MFIPYPRRILLRVMTFFHPLQRSMRAHEGRMFFLVLSFVLLLPVSATELLHRYHLQWQYPDPPPRYVPNACKTEYDYMNH